jgi:hypothetical protein
MVTNSLTLPSPRNGVCVPQLMAALTKKQKQNKTRQKNREAILSEL